MPKSAVIVVTSDLRDAVLGVNPTLPLLSKIEDIDIDVAKADSKEAEIPVVVNVVNIVIVVVTDPVKVVLGIFVTVNVSVVYLVEGREVAIV